MIDDTPRRSSRLWIPLLVLVASISAGFAIWHWPSDWEHVNRSVTIMFLGMVTILLLAIWLLFLSHFPSWARLTPVAVLLVGGGAFALCVREVQFSADMIPTFIFRWEKTHDDVLEEDRRRAKQEAERKGVTAEKTWPLEKPAAPPDKPASSQEKPARPQPGSIWNFPVVTGFLGERRNGVVEDTRLDADWNAKPPEKLWRQPVGGGYAAFATLMNRAVTIEQRRGKEAVVCYDVPSGYELWAYDYPARFQEKLGGDGPRATPAVVGLGDRGQGLYDMHRVYSLGGTGSLVALDLKTGEKVWEDNILTNNANLQWGMAGSPLFLFDAAGNSKLDKAMVIVAPGVQADSAKGRAVIAYDARTGKEVWASGNHRGAYSSPMESRFNGEHQILVLDGDALTCYDEVNGKELWHYEWKTYSDINASQPLLLDRDRVFISSGYGKGCAMLQVKKEGDNWSVKPIWQNQYMRCKFTSPVHRDGYIYGLDEGILTCLSAETGQRKWKDGRYGHGQMLLVDKHLLVLSESGQLVLVEATPDGHHELAKFDAISGKTWNAPALTDCLVFVRNHEEMACYRLPGTVRKPVTNLPSD